MILGRISSLSEFPCPPWRRRTLMSVPRCYRRPSPMEGQCCPPRHVHSLPLNPLSKEALRILPSGPPSAPPSGRQPLPGHPVPSLTVLASGPPSPLQPVPSTPGFSLGIFCHERFCSSSSIDLLCLQTACFHIPKSTCPLPQLLLLPNRGTLSNPVSRSCPACPDSFGVSPLGP